ncbi:hypothetical protein [Xanthomonas medicagonis]|uniref:hypothetical protein n=1 Tax=Xanthomonas medicagonis TaxID=3160841 RepID=UPI00351425B2
MAGKFLKRGDIVDVIKSAERNNALQRRIGLPSRALRFIPCSYADPDCGSLQTIDLAHTRPAMQGCDPLIRTDNKARASVKRGRTRAASRPPRGLA